MEPSANREEVLELDLLCLTGALLKKSWVLGLSALVCAAAVLLGTCLLVTPKYQSTAKFYVGNNALSQTASISSGDISASRSLVKTHILILQTRATLDAVMAQADLHRSYDDLLTMIRAEPVEATEILQVTVTSPDPQEAEAIANAIVQVLPERVRSVTGVDSARVMETAVAATEPSSPNLILNALIGFLAGFFLSALYLTVRELTDAVIRTEEDLSGLPVLACVPEQGESGEAWKLLRTKLQFSFPDCQVIGISSALPAEGKTFAAQGLAREMSLLGKRVVLIDCSLRRPALGPGLSEYLAQSIQAPIREAPDFHHITAGDVPPNPLELLSSPRMAELIRVLRNEYDCILLDLPPVGQMGDALVASRLADGVLLVVRRNLCRRPALKTAVRELSSVGVRVLGVVFNGAPKAPAGKSHNRYYKPIP